MEMLVRYGILKWQRTLQAENSRANQFDQKISALSRHYLQVTGNEIAEDFEKLNNELTRKTEEILNFLKNDES